MSRRASDITIAVVDALLPSVSTGSITGPTIDTYGAGSVSLIVRTPSYTTCVYTIQHSDTTTDGDFVAVPTAQVIGGSAVVGVVTSPSKAAPTRHEYVGTKRYVRIVRGTGTGTSADVPAHSGVAVLSNLLHSL